MSQEYNCPCGSKTTDTILMPNSVHYAKIVCTVCRKFVKWKKAPDNENKRTGCPSVSIVANFHGFKKEFCFFCGRTKEQLGWNETLTVDHIKKIEEGGADNKQNMQILCSACHKLKHWADLYTRKHLERFWK